MLRGWRGLIAGLALAFLALPAHADDWADCNGTDDDMIISSCSAVIDAGSVK